MSGGHFDYAQNRMRWDIAPMLQRLIANNNKKPEWVEDKDWNGQRYSEETIAEFKKGLEALRQAFVYVQRIDWLVCGDDDEDTFHPRLKDDLAGGFQFDPPELNDEDD